MYQITIIAGVVSGYLLNLEHSWISRRQIAAGWAADWSVISLLLGFSIFFLLFYILNPAEKLLGSFSITTIGLALRPLFTSHYLIYNLTDMEWIWVVRFEYLSLFMVIIGWSWFVQNLYPSVFARIFAWINTVCFLIASCLTLFLPVSIFSYSTSVYYPLMILLISYLLYKSFPGCYKKAGLDLMYFLAFILLLVRRVS